MDQSEAALSIVEALWKKSFEFSRDLKDPLISLLTKTFETITVYLGQSIDYEYMQTQITSLDNERQLALQSENNNDVLRCLSLGLIEAVQVIMSRDTKKIQEMIEKGHIPIPDFPINFPLLRFDLKEEQIDEVQPIPAENQVSALNVLSDDMEFKEEDVPNDDMQDPVDNFDLAEDNSFNEQIDNRDSTIQSDINGEEHVEEIVDNDGDMEERVPNEKVDESADEPIEKLGEEDGIDIPKTANLRNQCITIKKEETMDEMDDRRRSKYLQSENGYSTIPTFTVLPSKPKEEAIDIDMGEEAEEKADELKTVAGGVMDSNQIEMVEETEENQIEKEKEKTGEEADKLKDSSENIEKEKIRKSSGKVSKHKSHGPSMKKSRLDSKKKNDLTAGRNYTELECPECEFRTNSVQSWCMHLFTVHSTNTTKAGLILRCECGNESATASHSRGCKISKITVVRKEDGTIAPVQTDIRDSSGCFTRRNHTELECPECEHRTMSVRGWMQHLDRSHSFTPTQAGLILRCECGNESLSDGHARICKISKITVVRKGDGTTKEPQAS